MWKITEKMVVAAMLVITWGGLVSAATTRTVILTTDTNSAGELRYEISNATAGDTVNFSSSLYLQTIPLGSYINLNKALTIDGGGNSITVVSTAASDIFSITANDVHVRNLCLLSAQRAVFYNNSAAGSGSTIIENCRIGIDYSNNTSLAYASWAGVYLTPSANLQHAVTIRSNIISGNLYGIYGISTQGVTIDSNIIGLDSTGLLARGNFNGIVLSGSAQCSVGTDTAHGNVVSANSNTNLALTQGSHDNTLFGNVIGLRKDTSDVTWLASGVSGIDINGSNHNIIGKPASGATSYYNIIANNSYGIHLRNGSAGNTIQANYIGINTASATAGNTQGIVIDDSYGNLVGGSRTGTNGSESNVIGIADVGVSINSGEGNSICGNYIGTDRNGVDIGGGTFTIGVSSAHNLIGGPNLDAAHQYGNYIAGGQLFLTVGADNTVICGNFLGVNPATGSQLPGYANLFMFDTLTCRVGGTQNAERNFFCNGEPGIDITGSSANNTVLNNWINVLPNGTSPAAPMAIGINLGGNTAANLIGQASLPGNLIAYTTTAGIAGSGATVLNNAFYGNTICAFSGTGISLSSGANNNKAAPVIASAGPFTVAGTSQANDTIELFQASRGAGLVGGSLRHIAYCTAVGTAWTYTITAGDGLLDGMSITALATDTSHNTSAFSGNAIFHGPTPTPTATISPTATITPTQTPTVTTTAGIQTADLAGRRVLAFPNPGRDRIKFAVALEQAGDVKIEIYNLLGERVTELAENSLPAGVNVLNWNCQNISPGIYVARVFSGGAKIATVKVGIAK